MFLEKHNNLIDKSMKQQLIIIAILIVSSIGSSHAGLNISGTGRLIITAGSDAGAHDSPAFTQEGYYIGITVEKKLDDDFAISGGVWFNNSKITTSEQDNKGYYSEQDNIKASWDKTSMAIAGKLGKLEITNKGDVSDLSGWAGYVAPGAYSLDGFSALAYQGRNGLGNGQNSLLLGYGKTDIGIPRGTTRLNYYSKNINGFIFGMSVMESGGDSEWDAVKEGKATDGVENGVITIPDVEVAGVMVPATTTAQAKQHIIDKFLGEQKTWQQKSVAYGIRYATQNLLVGYSKNSYQAITRIRAVAGLVNSAETPMPIPLGNNYDDNTDQINGEYSVGWKGYRQHVRYIWGPVGFAYSKTEKVNNFSMTGSVSDVDARADEFKRATLDNVNTTYGIVFNYGAGQIGYNYQSEDYPIDEDGEQIVKQFGTAVIGINHQLTEGIEIYAQQISGEGDSDPTKDGFEKNQEVQIGLKVSF